MNCFVDEGGGGGCWETSSCSLFRKKRQCLHFFKNKHKNAPFLEMPGHIIAHMKH